MQPHDPSGLLPKDHTARKWLVPGIVTAVVLVGLTFGITFTKQEADRQVSAAPAPAAQIAVTAAGFDVTTLRIQAGQNVVWESQDAAEHQLALTDASPQAEGFGAGVRFGIGESYSYAFERPGTYQYYDKLNPLQFKGTITVTE
jgi:plastocyanin